MPRATLVRYRTRPDAADENTRLIEAVFAGLAAAAPPGVRYTAVRLPDGVSFVHLAQFDDDDAALTGLPAFAAFSAGVAERCDEGPVPLTVQVVGSY